MTTPVIVAHLDPIPKILQKLLRSSLLPLSATVAGVMLMVAALFFMMIVVDKMMEWMGEQWNRDGLNIFIVLSDFQRLLLPAAKFGSLIG